ncbi:MAG TPA: LysE family translocator [Candidatus Nanopelagicaceae bacterium]|nr:LysE family translocator [Candidatus Nanopelagicaceae bacterium]
MLHLLRVIPAFAATALLLAILPGQGVAMLLRQTIAGGKEAGFRAAWGNGSGLVVWALCSALGLSAVFAASPAAYNALRLIGAGYLLALALSTLYALRKESGKFDLDRTSGVSLSSSYRVGLITNLTNVKAAVFAVAFIPQFIPRGFSIWQGIVILGLVQAFVSSVWYMLLVLMVDRATALLARATVRRWLTGASAAGLMVLATGLLLAPHR